MHKFLQSSAIVCLLLVFCCAFDDGGCDTTPAPKDNQVVAAQAQLTDEANAQTGLPGITHFTEKKLVKRLYELRDKSIATYTYTQDMEGRLWHVCDSIGYGLPYGVQYSNPERALRYNETNMAGNLALPQSEPNGLFMPPTAEGTWVFCANPDGKGAPEPVYIEPRVIVSPFKLKAAGDYGYQAAASATK